MLSKSLFLKNGFCEMQIIMTGIFAVSVWYLEKSSKGKSISVKHKYSEIEEI